MNDTEMKTLLTHIKSNLRVTKVVATRAVKGKTGDVFCAFAAGWNTVQEDGTQGMISLAGDAAEASSGMSLMEAKVAHYLVAMQADIAAHESAVCSGLISPQSAGEAITHIKRNYSKLIRRAVGNDGTETQIETAAK